MNSSEVLTFLEAKKIVPVIAIEKAEDAIPLVDVMNEGGLGLAEITFRTQAAPEAISRIAKERPDIFLGAGTVLTPDQLKLAFDCGAKFAVAPGFNPRVLEEAHRLGIPFFPGVMTPSEIEGALSMDCRVFKYFPAEAAGGLKLLKSMAAPYLHLDTKFVPTGGINLSNMADYLREPMITAVGGTWIAKKDVIAKQDWPKITATCKQALRMLSE